MAYEGTTASLGTETRGLGCIVPCPDLIRNQESKDVDRWGTLGTTQLGVISKLIARVTLLS